MRRMKNSVQIYKPNLNKQMSVVAIIVLAVLANLPAFAQTGWFQLYPPISPDFRGVCFPADCQTGYVVGHNGATLKTTDAGQSWTLENSGTAYTLTAVDFPVDAQTGIIVGWY